MDSLTLDAERCPNCSRATLTVHVGQSFPANKLVWYISQSCSACGFATEEDNYGEIVEPWRGRLLEKYGVWCISIDRKDLSVNAMKVLSNVLQLSFQQLVEWKHAETSHVHCGTHAEAAYYQDFCARNGIIVTVEKMP